MQFLKNIIENKLKLIFIALLFNPLLTLAESSFDSELIDYSDSSKLIFESDNSNSKHNKKIYSNIIKNENLNSNFYILGPDDSFYLSINELSQLLDSDSVPNIEGEFVVDPDGYVNLPRLKKIKVGGLTIKELTESLNLKYKTYLKNVDVVIKVTKYRDAKIYLDGEIKNPGLHVLRSRNPSPIMTNTILSNINPTPTGSRTVFDAIRMAGGVSLKADLGNIQITRINSISNGGGRIKASVNLFETLDLKDTSQNINLKDGDTIFVPTLNNKKPLVLTKILKSNINPKFINVYFSGRVKEPGIKQLFNASTLVDGINIAGGTKIIKGNVKFLRYNNDGTIDKRVFKFKRNAKRGSYKNPYLYNGDIIFVGDSLLSITSEVLNEITDPLRGILSTYSFFKILND